MAISRLSDAAFADRVCTAWARRMGIFFDHSKVVVRAADDSGFSGRGIFATTDLAPGDFFAVIPQTACMQASDLGLSTRRYFADLATQPAAPIPMRPHVQHLSALDALGKGDPSVSLRADVMEERDMAEAFGQGFQVLARGSDAAFEDLPMIGLLDSTQPRVDLPAGLASDSDMARQRLPPLSSEERDWWQLALVLALERRRGAQSPWFDYMRYGLPAACLMDVSDCFRHQAQLLMRGRLPSPETSMKPPSRNESPLIAPLTPSGFTEMRGRVLELERVRSGYAWRFAALFNRNLTAVCRTRGYAGLQPTLLRPSDLRWSMDVVTSRANNFSFFQSTDMPRPYGIRPDPIPGAQSTLCPFFDLLNHSMEMNVLVADVRMGGGPAPENDEDGPAGPEKREGAEWAESPAEGGAVLTLGSLGKVAAGEELCYVYNAPVTRHPDTGVREVDVAGSIARWGFLPPPPLS